MALRVGQFVGFDAGDHGSMLGMIEHDVLFDLIVVREPEVAIRALPVLIH
jgi:hypothetical protein